MKYLAFNTKYLAFNTKYLAFVLLLTVDILLFGCAMSLLSGYFGCDFACWA